MEDRKDNAKKIRRGFLRSLTRIFNYKLWIGLDSLKSYWFFVVSMVQRLFMPKTTVVTETFDDAMKRLKISSDELQRKARSLWIISIILVLLGCGTLGYAIYLLAIASYHGFLWTLSLTLIVWSMAFRYHFWFFQISQKKLGCTIKEWLYWNIRGKSYEK